MKQIRIAIVLHFLALFIYVTPAAAAGPQRGMGFFLDETFLPVIVNKNDTESFNTAPGVATETGSGFDSNTTLGFAIKGQFLVGATYNTYSRATERAAVAGGDSGLEEKLNRSEFGPTLGYLRNGWRVLFTYFVSGNKKMERTNTDETQTITGHTTIKNSKLSGYQLAVGYSFSLGANFEMGPSLVYKSLTYANQSKTNHLNAAEDYPDSALYTKATETFLTPMFSLQLRF